MERLRANFFSLFQSLGCVSNKRRVGVRFLVAARDISVFHYVRKGPPARLAFCAMTKCELFPREWISDQGGAGDHLPPLASRLTILAAMHHTPEGTFS